jgi:hypothetical protein
MEFVVGIDFLRFVRGLTPHQLDHSTDGQASHSTDNSVEALSDASSAGDARTVPLSQNTAAHHARHTDQPVISFGNLRDPLRAID